MISRENILNIAVFADTTLLCRSRPMLNEAILNATAGQNLYLEPAEYLLPQDYRGMGQGGKITVSGKRAFEAAAPYARAGKRVCVLNFASAVDPGGGVISGAGSQEESLCRCSTLYFSLAEPDLQPAFYRPHRDLPGHLHNDDCIYTPGVVVFKSDTAAPELLPEGDWYRVDVLTCAAPDLRHYWLMRGAAESTNPVCLPEAGLRTLLASRIRKIFAVAVREGADVLVLGAFGCGVFHCPPDIVADVFRQEQEAFRGSFDCIEYAVPHSGGPDSNHTAFLQAMRALLKEG